jgi:hypothetical protein
MRLLDTPTQRTTNSAGRQRGDSAQIARQRLQHALGYERRACNDPRVDTERPTARPVSDTQLLNNLLGQNLNYRERGTL